MQANFRPTQIVSGLQQLARGVLSGVGVLVGVAVVAPVLVPIVVLVHIPAAVALWARTGQELRFFRGMTRSRRPRSTLGPRPICSPAWPSWPEAARCC